MNYLDNYISYHTAITNKSPGTIKQYRCDIIRFLKFCGIDSDNIAIESLQKITTEDIHAYLTELTNKNIKPATRRKNLASIKSFFEYLAKNKIITEDIAKNVETPKLPKRPPSYLSLKESQKLLRSIENLRPKKRRGEFVKGLVATKGFKHKDRDYAIVALFLNCGLRLSELVGIDIKDINFNEEELKVIGKGNKERTIYLNEACMKAIEAYLAVRPKVDIDALFLSERNVRISVRTVQYMIEDKLKNIGLDVTKYTTHKLRHTAATLMYQYGKVDIRELQEILGHENIQTTTIYTHTNKESLKSSMAKNPLSMV